jgi:hypothetical protein
MSSSSGQRTRRALAFSASALIAVLVGMKLLSRRTYDATNPRSRANGYLLSHTVSVARSPGEVFDFITYRMKDHNLALAAAHEKFELLRGEGLTLGALFRTEEFTGDEGVRNEYVVREVIPNRRIHLASTPSRILRRTNGQVRQIGTCNAYVYFDLDESPSGTRLTQTIVIEIPNFLVKFITDVMGGAAGGQPLAAPSCGGARVAESGHRT